MERIEKFDDYQQATKEFALYPKEVGLLYTTCGLLGESSEIAEKVLAHMVSYVHSLEPAQLDLFIKAEEAQNFYYLTDLLHLVVDTGKKLEKFKKQVRKGELKLPVIPPLTEEQTTAINFESSDALWYISELATSMNTKMADIATMNIEKLSSRKTRGTLHGNGDSR